jgi:hypothetical protein
VESAYEIISRIVEMELEEALEIGREFRQDAIFWVGKDGRIDVVSCVDGERCHVGLWSDRIQSRITEPHFSLPEVVTPQQHLDKNR